jgi:hypothetical protein
VHITTDPRVKAAEEPIRQAVTDALLERRELGVQMPSDLPVHISIWGPGGAAYEATKGVLEFCVVGLALEHLGNIPNLATMVSLLEKAEDTFGVPVYDALLKERDARKAMQEITTQARRKGKMGWNIQGQAKAHYDAYAHMFIEQAPDARQALIESMRAAPHIIAQKNLVQVVARHELDHAAFFQSPWGVRFAETMQSADVAKHEKAVEISTVAEVAGHLYSNVPWRQWTAAAIDTAAIRAISEVKDTYIRGYFKSQIQTAAYVQLMQEGLVAREDVEKMVSGKKSAAGISQKIAPQCFSMRVKYDAIARQAVTALADAYKTDPSKVARAYRADSSESFFAALK